MYPYEMSVHYAEARRFDKRLALLSRLGLDPVNAVQTLGGEVDPDYGYEASYVRTTSWVAPDGTYLELGACASREPDHPISAGAGEPGVLWAVRCRPPGRSGFRRENPAPAAPDRAARLKEAIARFYEPAVSDPRFDHAVALAPATSYEPRPYGFARGLPCPLLPYSLKDALAPHLPTRFFRTDSRVRVNFADGLVDEVMLESVAKATIADDPEAVAGVSSSVATGTGVAVAASPFFGPGALLAGCLVGFAHHSARKSAPPAVLTLYGDPDATRTIRSYPVPQSSKEAYEFVGGLNSAP